MKINARTSLRYKQIYVLAIGLIISFGMYLFTQSMGNYLISSNHLNAESAGSRLETYQDSIENYIKKNKLSVKDVRALSKWIKSHKYTYVTIYSGDETIYESGFWNESYYSYETAEIFLEDTQQLTRDIAFTDGTYSVSIIDFSEIKWYNLVFYVSLGVFLLFLFGIVIYYNHRIIARIMLLSKEVSLIEQGNLEQPIYHKGSDEIAQLAINADNMRNSIITRYKSEKEAFYNEDNDLCFAGRKDFQIKHMGHRIELEEIEMAINCFSPIERACCVFEEKRNRITAFYVGSMEGKELSEQMRKSLPSYMIPTAFRTITEFPITPNGKIDRKKLLEMCL